MGDQLVSIIIPVYNVEKYLEQCILSVLHQTYEHIEIILVDDGSTDQCGKICDTFAMRDNRVQVIHKSNGGLSDARNEGMRFATGDWLFFLDSDDYIVNDCIELLVEMAQKFKADIVIGDSKKFFEDQVCNQEVESSGIYKILDTENALEAYFYRKIPGYAWGKLYSKKVVQNIHFPKGKLFEDAYTVYKFLARSGRTVFTENIILMYRQRKGSIVNSRFSRSFLDILEANKEALKYFKNSSLRIKRAIISKKFVSATDILSRIPLKSGYRLEYQIVAKEIYKTRKSVLKDKKNTFLVRGMAVIACVSIKLLQIVTKMRKFIRFKRV